MAEYRCRHQVCQSNVHPYRSNWPMEEHIEMLCSTYQVPTVPTKLGRITPCSLDHCIDSFPGCSSWLVICSMFFWVKRGREKLPGRVVAWMERISAINPTELGSFIVLESQLLLMFSDSTGWFLRPGTSLLEIDLNSFVLLLLKCRIDTRVMQEKVLLAGVWEHKNSELYWTMLYGANSGTTRQGQTHTSTLPVYVWQLVVWCRIWPIAPFLITNSSKDVIFALEVTIRAARTAAPRSWNNVNARYLLSNYM